MTDLAGGCWRLPRTPIYGTIAGPVDHLNAMTGLARLYSQTAATRGRMLLWVGALVLLLQLFAAVGHDHETEARTQECVACSVLSHAQAAPPAPPASVPVSPARLAGLLPAALVRQPNAAPAGWLLPQPQAPPLSSFHA